MKRCSCTYFCSCNDEQPTNGAETMTFSELLAVVKATYREQPRSFHVLATRYYLGAETCETLRAQTTERPCNRFFMIPPTLTSAQVDEIIRNRKPFTNGTETMKVYVTKYALTQGILLKTVRRTPIADSMVIDVDFVSETYHGSNWHLTWEDAVKKAEDMRQRKIASLKKSLVNLESMDFTKP